MIVPSQLMPEKPVPILSMTPSRTDDMTTSAKTPSMRSVSVNVDRSLCAQSSTRPPLTISQPRASRAPTERCRARAGCAAAGESEAPTHSYRSASMGDRREAFHAGNRANTKPKTPASRYADTKLFASM